VISAGKAIYYVPDRQDAFTKMDTRVDIVERYEMGAMSGIEMCV
jgi:hypothetical protein